MNLEKKREENKNKKLLLLGTAASCFEPDYENNDYEIWAVGSAFGEAHADIKRIDLGFEIHPIDQIAKIAKDRNVNYNKFKCPMFVQNAAHPLTKQLMKNPKKFPLNEILKYIDDMGASRFFTSSFCYMLVYAAYMGYKDVYLYKILLTNESEYFLERPGVEYWFEWLGMHEGMNFHFPEDAEMCSNSILYGYEERPHLWKIESRKKHLWESLARQYYEAERLAGDINRASGMIEMYNIMKKADEKKVNELVIACKKQINDTMIKYRNTRDQYMQFGGALQTMQYTEFRSY
jgi:hypothetical protein